MGQWAFHFNQQRCIGCRACELACKNWNDDKRGDADLNIDSVSNFQEKYYVEVGSLEKNSAFINPDTGENNYPEARKYYMKENWRNVTRHPYGSITKDANGKFICNFDVQNLSIACNHCASPNCVAVCPTNYIYKEIEFGAVVINKNAECISCGECQTACPWNVPQFYDDLSKYSEDDPAKPKMTKCTFCIDRLKEGLKPACVAACLNRALDAGPIEEMQAKYPDSVKGVLKEFKPGATGPNILFTAKQCKSNV